MKKFYPCLLSEYKIGNHCLIFPLNFPSEEAELLLGHYEDSDFCLGEGSQELLYLGYLYYSGSDFD